MSLDGPPLVGDLFVCRDYETKTYSFPVTRKRGEDSCVSSAEPGFCSAENESIPATVTQPVLCSSAAATDFDLTGQIVWLVSVVTSHYVAQEGWRDCVGRDCIELGAGTALVGLTASRWARSMVLTDNEDEVLSLMRQNLVNVPPSCAGSVHELSWGDDGDHARLAAASGRDRFPVILGADIVYWSASISPLIATVSRLLARRGDPGAGPEGGVFILGYNNRVSSMHVRLLEEARAAGLQWRVVGFDWLDEASRESYGDFTKSMTLYRFTWAS